MNVLCIDIGNTRCKAAFFSNNKLKAISVHEHIADVKNAFQQTPDGIIVSDVRSVKDDLASLFSPVPVHVLNYLSPHGLQLLYATPHTLGSDRIAAVAGARAMNPGHNCLVFDCGTCMTTDFADTNGNYFGGAISPGLSMRLRAMHHFTGKLPEIAFEPITEFTGSNTRDCMLSGAWFGMADEINGSIARYESRFGDVKVFITGGDAPLFVNAIKNNIFAPPNLVLEGLNQIAQHVF